MQSISEIICGDCFELLDYLEPQSVQLILTSPPYNIGKEYEKKETIDSYLDKMKAIIKKMVSKLKSGGSICW